MLGVQVIRIIPEKLVPFFYFTKLLTKFFSEKLNKTLKEPTILKIIFLFSECPKESQNFKSET